jgi:argonaute-like protein implicated in RNA metabolism and viral defense
VVGILKNLLRIYNDQEETMPSHLIIHRDGKFYLDVEDLVERLEDAGEFFPKFDLVEIRKSGNPRIAEYANDSFEVADKGTGFVSRNADHAYLATTGKPELKAGNPIGTPRPIRVVKRHGSTGLDTLTKQVYWLSEAHVGSISRSTRLPITTYYADRCAEHGRKGYLLNGEVIKGIPYI